MIHSKTCKKKTNKTRSDRAILSLGAGFDSTYFRLKAKGSLQHTSYFEIDFPELMKRKRRIIQESAQLLKLIDGISPNQIQHIVFSSRHLKLVGVDMVQLDLLTEVLWSAGLDPTLPTLLLSEVVLTYMNPTSSSSVIKWAADIFQDGMFTLYEQIHPEDPFGLVMMAHFNKLGSPLRSLSYFPNKSEQYRRCLNLGWQDVDAVDMNEFYFEILSPGERKRLEELEPFDEYEEWNLKCSHYMLLNAYKGKCLQMKGHIAAGAGHRPAGGKEHDLPRTGHRPAGGKEQDTHSTGHRPAGPAGGKEQDPPRTGHRPAGGKEQDIHSTGHRPAGPSGGKEQDPPSTGHRPAGGKEQDTHSTGHRPSGGKEQDPPSTGHRPAEGKEQDPHSTGYRPAGGKEQDKHSTGHRPVGGKEQDTHSTGHRPAGPAGGKEQDPPSTGHRPVGGKEQDPHSTGHRPAGGKEPAKQISWRAFDAPSAHLRCFGHSLSWIDVSGKPLLCLLGGFGERNKKHGRLDDVVLFDVLERRSYDIPGREIRCSNTRCSPVKRMHHTVTAVQGSRLVVIGGRSSPMQCCDDVAVATVQQRNTTDTVGECHLVATGGYQVTVERLPVKGVAGRWRHSATRLFRDGVEYIFVYGGRNTEDLILSDAHLLNTKTWVWIKVNPAGATPGPRHSHTADLYKERILTMGGLDARLLPVNHMHALDVNTLHWTKIQINGCLHPRYSHTSAVVGDQLILLGGVNLSYSPPGLAVIHLLTYSVTEYFIMPPVPQEFFMFHGHASVILSEKELIIIGGGGNCFSFGTHFNGQPIIFNLESLLATDEERILQAS